MLADFLDRNVRESCLQIQSRRIDAFRLETSGAAGLADMHHLDIWAGAELACHFYDVGGCKFMRVFTDVAQECSNEGFCSSRVPQCIAKPATIRSSKNDLRGT